MNTVNVSDLSKLRPLLLAFSIIGFLVINVPFLYYVSFDKEVYDQAIANRVAMIFMGEAMLLMVFFAVLIAKLGWKKPGWIFFISMSLIGSLAFSIPLHLYLILGKRE